ncbi:GNAT family N-acetyltransferase [Rhizobium lusitanum]|nr:GNAT family N-acetyltransferase [Rhizobium lusitanum]
MAAIGLKRSRIVVASITAGLKQGTQSLTQLVFRRASAADLTTIVTLLADDVLGAAREAVRPEDAAQYREAFSEIEADPNQFLCVVEDGSEIVGTFQLTIIPGLSRRGAKRAQIESVRVSHSRRNEQIGEAMFKWAIDYSRSHGCALMQLTTDKARPDAHRFYDRMGFEPTHVGYKLQLS